VAAWHYSLNGAVQEASRSVGGSATPAARRARLAAGRGAERTMKCLPSYSISVSVSESPSLKGASKRWPHALRMRRPLASTSVIRDDSLMLGVLQHLLDTLHVLHDLATELLSGARQVGHATCAAFARTSWKRSCSTCQTGFQ
jgi:hypothetical protein